LKLNGAPSSDGRRAVFFGDRRGAARRAVVFLQTAPALRGGAFERRA
jgi:hypothetical protein